MPPISPESILAAGVAFILLALGVLLAAYFFCSESKRGDVVKFIGGLVVVLIALYANSPGVYALAIFVAGLIIASERFMSLLVALLKGNKEFLTSENFVEMMKGMSGEEIKDKNELEVQEVKTAEALAVEAEPNVTETAALPQESKRDAEEVTNVPPIRIQPDAYSTAIPYIENIALAKFAKSLSFPIQKQVRLGDLMFDAGGVSRDGRPYFFEVKVFPDITDNRGGIKTSQIITRLKLYVPLVLGALQADVRGHYKGRKPPVFLIVLVLNTSKDLEKTRRKVVRAFDALNQRNSRVLLRLTFYNLHKMIGPEDAKFLADATTN